METGASREHRGSARTSVLGSFDSKSSLLLLEERPDDMTDESLQTYYDQLQMSAKIFKLENIMFERFAERVDPTILTYIYQALSHHAVLSTHHSSPLTPSFSSVIGRKSSIDSVASHRTMGTAKNWFTASITTRHSERMPKLSLQQKMDIVVREIELITNSLEIVKQKWKHTHARLLSELEEANLRHETTLKAKEELDKGFSSDWVDKVTGRVPAEKFLWFIKEQIHKTEGNIERHRLRTSTLMGHYSRATKQLHDKEELEEGLCPVDFDQQKINNAQLKEKLEKKNQYLLELKTIARECGLRMNEKKKYLLKVTKELEKLKENIMAKETALKNLKIDTDKVNTEIEVELQKHNKLRKVIAEYEAPSVLEYIKQKAVLDGLLKKKRSWSHRKNMQN